MGHPVYLGIPKTPNLSFLVPYFQSYFVLKMGSFFLGDPVYYLLLIQAMNYPLFYWNSLTDSIHLLVSKFNYAAKCSGTTEKLANSLV